MPREGVTLAQAEEAVDDLARAHQIAERDLTAELSTTKGLNELVAELKQSSAQLTTDVKNADQRTTLARKRATEPMYINSGHHRLRRQSCRP